LEHTLLWLKFFNTEIGNENCKILMVLVYRDIPITDSKIDFRTAVVLKLNMSSFLFVLHKTQHNTTDTA